MEKIVEQVSLDREWVELIKRAKHLGMTPEEIRQFLQQSESIHNA
ncbi:anti-repressor SinI family protein [Oceanobacillus kapialis]|uniref:Anti-repressor SinI family protein n=1 Tax=Oceanobacillus kapialis TaxID=481353 RepID=A0ABW5Q0L8_9BACI